MESFQKFYVTFLNENLRFFNLRIDSNFLNWMPFLEYFLSCFSFGFGIVVNVFNSSIVFCISGWICLLTYKVGWECQKLLDRFDEMDGQMSVDKVSK